jgi:hypothetical protein
MKPFFHREESDCSYLFDERKSSSVQRSDVDRVRREITRQHNLSFPTPPRWDPYVDLSTFSTRSQQANFGAALPTMTTSTPNNTAPEPTNAPHNVTFDDDTSDVSEVFNAFNLHDDDTTTTVPTTTATTVNDKGGYFACPTTPGLMQGHVFFDPASMAFFQHRMPQYPIAQFRTYTEAEDYSRTTFYPLHPQHPCRSGIER